MHVLIKGEVFSVVSVLVRSLNSPPPGQLPELPVIISLHCIWRLKGCVNLAGEFTYLWENVKQLSHLSGF